MHGGEQLAEKNGESLDRSKLPLCLQLLNWGPGSAREIVYRILVCDGDDKRTQRILLFSKRWTACGVAVGDHASQFKRVAMIPIAEGASASAT